MLTDSLVNKYLPVATATLLNSIGNCTIGLPHRRLDKRDRRKNRAGKGAAGSSTRSVGLNANENSTLDPEFGESG
jgi:hypothetical protein